MRWREKIGYITSLPFADRINLGGTVLLAESNSLNTFPYTFRGQGHFNLCNALIKKGSVVDTWKRENKKEIDCSLF